jgi:hypothetical protein
VFQSKLHREDMAKKDECPAPGAYNVEQNIAKKPVVSGTGTPLLAGIGDTKKREAGFN